MILNTGLLTHFYGDKIPMHTYFLCLLAVLLAAYFLGSINSAILFSRTVYHEDIRTKGSGNAGMTNMLRTYGKGAAVLTLVGDMGKTVIAILLSGLIFGFNYMSGVAIGGQLGECYLVGLFAVLGHIYPVYYKFKGGKGVLVTSTMALMLSPVAFLILLLLFVGIVAVSKYVSLGSIVIASLYPVVMHGYFAFMLGSIMLIFAALSTIILAILIVYCHRANIVRIGNRTENKISFRKKNTDGQ